MVIQRSIVLFIVLLMLAGFVIPACSAAGETVSKTVVIGAMPFNEQYILAEIAGQLLEKEGYSYEVNSGLNNAMLYQGVKKGQIDLYTDYTSAIPTYFEDQEPFPNLDPDSVTLKVEEMVIADGVVFGGTVGFRNDYQMAVRDAFAAENEVKTLSDLAPYAKDLVLGSDLVFHLDEIYGLPNLEKIYEYSFKEVIPMEPTLMFEAIKNSQVDIVPASSTDSRIDLFNLTIIDDDKAALAPYDSIILITKSREKDTVFMSTLAKMQDMLDTETMRSLNKAFDLDKKDAEEIAHEFLIEQGLL
ncbi:MAG: glycine/betaine ABC transporter substrate-binding protein [Methanospirillaceae archaeon]|nr:glycine/betaine ABC transporter substrate-binding protein [Methanospirillaceae archaeon]